MPRLTDPESGVTVSVDDDYAKQLQSLGWSSPTAKKAAAPKRSSGSPEGK